MKSDHRMSDRQAAYKRLTNRLILLKLLTESNHGKLETTELREMMGMNAYHFRLSVSWLISYGHVIDKGEIVPEVKPPGRNPKNNLWRITAKGRRYLSDQSDPILDDLSLNLPNYTRIRRELNLSKTISNTEAVDLWNERTDYYLPFGDEELVGMY